MSASDGTVIGTTKVVDHGADADRWNLVVLGDGFRADQQAAYRSAVTQLVNVLQGTKPFDEVWEKINVHRVEVHSDESGADNPAACADDSTPAGGATSARTYFDASYCNNGIRRLLVVNAALAVTTANAQVPGWDAILVVVNHSEYGGSGGQVAVYSLAPGAIEIALHEIGHSAFRLADEYEYYQGCSSGETNRNNHPGPEPDAPNVTTVSDRTTLKWCDFVSGTTPIPTTQNADCTRCDSQPSPVAAGTIGLFEGAHYYHCGAYRPAFDCRMRSIGQPFCAVCQDAIKKKISAVASPSSPSSPSSPGGCFVATAVYGDPLHPDVVWLRRWRDRHLEPGARGRLVMRAVVGVYRRVGPPLARALRRRPRAAAVVRERILAPLVSVLRRWIGQIPPRGPV